MTRSPLRLVWTIAWVAVAVAAASAGLALGPTVAASFANQSETGWVRFAHFAAGDGPVTVSVGGKALGDHIAFQDVTNFVTVPVGHQSVVVAAANRPSTLLAVGRVTVPAGGADNNRCRRGARYHDRCRHVSGVIGFSRCGPPRGGDQAADFSRRSRPTGTRPLNYAHYQHVLKHTGHNS